MTLGRVGAYVDVEALVIAWLAERIPDVVATARLPMALPDQILWVANAGGEGGWNTIVARLDVSALVSGGYGAAADLMGAAHEAMGALDGQTVNDQPVYTVTCPMLPTAPFWSEDTDRLVATYDLEMPVL